MSVTGTNVVDRLNQLFTDTTNAKWTAAQKLEAVNMAIDSAFPSIMSVAVDSSQTIASGTSSYSPTATPTVEWGFSQAYSTNGSYPDVLLRRVSQRQNGTTWEVIIPDDLNYLYDGETLKLYYNNRLSRLSAIGDSVELPLDYLWKAAAYFLCQISLVGSAHFDVKPYEQLVTLYEKEMRESLIRLQRGQLPRLIPIVSDVGEGQTYDPNRGIYHV